MELKRIEEVSNTFNKQLPKGVFLNTRFEDKDNTMTIGWGSVGVMWGKPVLTVMVRYSRFSYKLIEESNVFTVSVPKEGELKDALKIAGTMTGADTDKFSKAGLIKGEGRSVDAPIIDNCELQLECKTLYKQSMDPGLLEPSINKKSYSNHDYHVFYIGEIVDCY